MKIIHIEQVASDIFYGYYNVMIDGKNFFDLSVKNDFRTNDSIRQIATGQGDD